MLMFCYSLTIVTSFVFLFFFFNDTATTEIYTLSLHDALPISRLPCGRRTWRGRQPMAGRRDRKSTRLNSSHVKISYAVFCLKKKKKINIDKSTINKKNIVIKQYKIVYITYHLFSTIHLLLQFE